MAIEENLNFDFVLDPLLRGSLERDVEEMKVTFEHGAWKACSVLGGSIVEALLLDYLISEGVIVDYDEASAKSFDDLITKSYKSKLITERVKEQAYLVKRYRNLIHQGRVLRSKEPSDKNSAMTTVALVNMVVEEIATSRRDSYGLTAEQFCKKIVADPQNSAVVAHLLKGMRLREKERLLCEVLPSAAFENEPRTWELILLPMNRRCLGTRMRCLTRFSALTGSFLMALDSKSLLEKLRKRC